MSPVSSSTVPADPLISAASGLHNHLRALFEHRGAELEYLHSLFNYSFTHGGREEDVVIREEGESFNPRLARLAQLLISEGGETSASVIGAAFLMVLEKKSAAAAPANAETKALAEAAHARTFDRLPAAAALALAYHLDQIRHLHRSRRSQSESSALLESARTLLSLASPEGRSQRLYTVLTHAISQQERRCTPS